MTPHKSEACQAEIEMLLEYDLIEPSKSLGVCGIIMAKNLRRTAEILLRKMLPERGDHKVIKDNTLFHG